LIFSQEGIEISSRSNRNFLREQSKFPQGEIEISSRSNQNFLREQSKFPQGGIEISSGKISNIFKTSEISKKTKISKSIFSLTNCKFEVLKGRNSFSLRKSHFRGFLIQIVGR
jgi:hypothetical protein